MGDQLNEQHMITSYGRAILKYLNNPNYVVSRYGIVKHKCSADCLLDVCEGAHPNTAGSEVKNPKWCLRGCVWSCDIKNCPFNHMRSIDEFYEYRSNDPKWFAENKHLLEEYYDSGSDSECDTEYDHYRAPHDVTFADYIN